jgi:hypothetical protein
MLVFLFHVFSPEKTIPHKRNRPHKSTIRFHAEDSPAILLYSFFWDSLTCRFLFHSANFRAKHLYNIIHPSLLKFHIHASSLISSIPNNRTLSCTVICFVKFFYYLGTCYCLIIQYKFLCQSLLHC